MSEVKKLHHRICKSFTPSLDLSLDGVQESKSSSVSLDIFSVSFQNCRTVYPIRIVRPINKYKLDEQNQIKEVIDDINSCRCHLINCICDNPKRSNLRCALCHSAYYACEYCEAKAQYITGLDPKNKVRGHLTWPFSTYHGPQRTMESIMEIVGKIENGQKLTRDEAKGFTGTSHLLHQKKFSLINNLPCEYMHLTCIGVIKRMVELSFNVGDSRKRNTKRKLSDVSLYNELISCVKFLREFSRRHRNLDVGVMKAQEFRNIGLFFYIIIIECIPVEFKKERKLWMQLAFLLRSCVLTNKEFDLISKTVLEKTAKDFYKNYESVFGERNCSYSVHTFASHILKIRGSEPLTELSAFKFENFYSELRNLFQPGTTSTSKQILRNCYMKRQMENHNCKKSIYYDIEKNGKENNSMVYYMDDNNEYQFLNIKKINSDGTLTCNPQGRYIYKCDLLRELKWEQVGVFKVGPYSNEQVVIPREKIEGKILKVQDFFLTCPKNVLREQ